MAVFPAVRVIEIKDVRVGDTIRVLTRDGDVEHTSTVHVAQVSIDPHGWTDFISPMGNEVTVFDAREVVVHLVSRPETSPEVEAIVTALGVTYDVASEMHSKGVRIRV